MNTVMQIDMQVETPTTLNMVPEMAVFMGGGAVDSVNGQTGDVVLTAADVGALPDSTEIPTKTSDLVNDSGFITSVPVDSVNGKTGTVVLNASDVGAMASGAQVVRYEAQTLTDAQQAQARANINAISADEMGTVFNIKGDVATYADLPLTGNTVGDVYYVADVSAGYVWLETTAHPLGYWEELGEPIDLSGYIEKPASPTTGQFLRWDGSTWAAETYTAPVSSVNGQTGAVVIGNATTSSAGLMSAQDKTDLGTLMDDYSSALTALGVI